MNKEKRPAIFLDIDDTLLDFHKAEALALRKALLDVDVEPAEETLRRYSAINKSQWELLEEGLLTRQQVLIRRFELLFQEFGIDASPAETRDRYEAHLAVGHFFMPGAPELLEELYGRCMLYIVSNGTGSVQAGRIASAGIGRYFERVFISEEIGFEKPSREFFRCCFAQISDFDPARAIIVGDSLTSDVRGGRNAGIKTCWYNPGGKAPRPDILPDYSIRSLAELPPLLNDIFP